jgi:hypothetical protein
MNEHATDDGAASWIKVRNPNAPGYLRVRDGLEG